MKHEYDIVIIGSGAGGGTVASRLAPLAAQGARIAVLESGPHYTRDYFTQRELEMMGLLWHGGAWPTEDGAITMAAGRGVGGSTMMYTGVTFRLPENVCEEWNVPGLDNADLAPRFDRLEEEVSAGIPDPDFVNDNNRLFKEACEKLAWKLEHLSIDIKGCQQNGFCNIGCISGGKQGTLEVQIPQAVSSGIDLIPNCHVERLAKHEIHATISPTPPGTHGSDWEPGEHTITAKQIVVAAGTPNSPALLMRSGYWHSFPALGRGVTLHPALTVYGVYPEEIKNYRGFPKTYFTSQFSESHHYYIETAFYYPFITTKHLGLWGRELKDLMKSYRRMMTMIVLVHDEANPDNRVILDDAKAPVIQYELSNRSIDALCHSQASCTQLLFAAGCEKAIMPCADRPVFSRNEVPDGELESFISRKNFLPNKTPVASAHLQGGCAMGDDSESSVCDAWGQVHGKDWLYVADGSLFPQSSHVNPYLTIMALADRVAEKVVEKA